MKAKKIKKVKPFYPVWYDKLFNMACSNIITFILYAIISVWLMITFPWYVVQDYRYYAYGKPKPSIKLIVKAQIKMLTFQDANMDLLEAETKAETK